MVNEKETFKISELEGIKKEALRREDAAKYAFACEELNLPKDAIERKDLYERGLVSLTEEEEGRRKLDEEIERERNYELCRKFLSVANRVRGESEFDNTQEKINALEKLWGYDNLKGFSKFVDIKKPYSGKFKKAVGSAFDERVRAARQFVEDYETKTK